MINSTRLWAKRILLLWSPGRQEFVDAYVNYVFQISVHEWYTAFSSGFRKVCGGKVLELFQPPELRAMMVGSSSYSWEELEEVSRQGAVCHPRGSGPGRAQCPEPGRFLKYSPGQVGLGGLLHLSGYFLLSSANGVQTSTCHILLEDHFVLFVFFLGRLPSTRVITQLHIPL